MTLENLPTYACLWLSRAQTTRTQSNRPICWHASAESYNCIILYVMSFEWTTAKKRHSSSVNVIVSELRRQKMSTNQKTNTPYTRSSPRLFIIFLQYLMARITRFSFLCWAPLWWSSFLSTIRTAREHSNALVSHQPKRSSVQLPTYCNQFECLRIQLFGWLSAWISWPAVSFAVRPSQMACHVHIMFHWIHCYVLCSQNHQPDEESRQTLWACILSNDKSEKMRDS